MPPSQAPWQAETSDLDPTWIRPGSDRSLVWGILPASLLGTYSHAVDDARRSSPYTQQSHPTGHALGPPLGKPT